MISLGGIFEFLPWPYWGVACTVCEIVAFTLRPRGPEDEPSDSVEAGLQIGCGAIVGFFAGVLWAVIHWKWKNPGVGVFASGLVGAVVCGALAFRFGDKFWDWVTGRRPW